MNVIDLNTVEWKKQARDGNFVYIRGIPGTKPYPAYIKKHDKLFLLGFCNSRGEILSEYPYTHQDLVEWFGFTTRVIVKFAERKRILTGVIGQLKDVLPRMQKS